MRSHGFALSVGVGTDIKYKWGPRLGSACLNQLSQPCRLPAEKPDSKSWRGKIKSASTERHASTKYFCLWKSFRRKFPSQFFLNRSRKLLSSGENITVARVVQE